jgi:hypothetical protein
MAIFGPLELVSHGGIFASLGAGHALTAVGGLLLMGLAVLGLSVRHHRAAGAAIVVGYLALSALILAVGSWG